VVSCLAAHARSRVSLLASRYGPTSWRPRRSRRRLEYRLSFSRFAAPACIAKSGRLARLQQATRRARPNHSLKRRANSVPPGPRGGTSFILHRAGLASHRRLPLSSNVRPRKRHSACELVWVNQGRWHTKPNCSEGTFRLHQKSGFRMSLAAGKANRRSHRSKLASSGIRNCASSTKNQWSRRHSQLAPRS
jgi:hypothetical protein